LGVYDFLIVVVKGFIGVKLDMTRGSALGWSIHKPKFNALVSGFQACEFLLLVVVFWALIPFLFLLQKRSGEGKGV
jgi:hypothetical protein